MLERERRLTNDAAHELRSPLTAIKTHLQVAAMTEGDTAKRALAQAEVGTDRLHRILEQLLMLARVEGRVSFDDGLSCTALEVAQLAIADASQQPAAHRAVRAQDASPTGDAAHPGGRGIAQPARQCPPPYPARHGHPLDARPAG